MLTSTTPFSALQNFKSHTIYSPWILYFRVLWLFYLKYEASLRPDTASVFFFSVSHSSLKIITFHSTSALDSEFPHHINNEFLWLCHDLLAACDDTSILWLLFEWNRLSENIFFMELCFIHRVLIGVLKVSIAYRNGDRYECNWLNYSTALYMSAEKSVILQK